MFLEELERRLLAILQSAPMPGKVYYGHFGGYFGRDTYGPITVEAVGTDWIVARDTHGVVQFAGFQSREHLLREVREWATEPE